MADGEATDNPDVPNTGDMSRLGAWFALLVAALAGALAIRREEQND